MAKRLLTLNINKLGGVSTLLGVLILIFLIIGYYSSIFLYTLLTKSDTTLESYTTAVLKDNTDISGVSGKLISDIYKNLDKMNTNLKFP